MAKITTATINVKRRWTPADRSRAEKLGLRLAPCDPERNCEVNVEETWLETPLGQYWIAAYRLVPKGGRFLIGEVRVFPSEDRKTMPSGPGEWSGGLLSDNAFVPGDGITARLLRQIKIGAVGPKIEAILTRVLREHGGGAFAPTGTFGERGIDSPKMKIKKSSAGRPKQPDIVFAKVAKFYVARLQRGSHRPAAEIAKRFKLSREKVRAMLHESRKRGLLTKATHGKWGGELTEKALAILKG